MSDDSEFLRQRLPKGILIDGRRHGSGGEKPIKIDGTVTISTDFAIAEHYE